ncbi:MAG: hypothetical protein HY717_08250 [Planctomycetes bacterium]|nr:hypothetical protein [Planctomycetota bacterium]
MTRLLSLLWTIAIVAFWLSMNGLLLRRQIEVRNFDLYRQGVSSYFGTDWYRERWMGIYRGSRKIGYTGVVFTKSLEEEGIQHHTKIDGRIAVDLFGKGSQIRINGTVDADLQMIPEKLSINIEMDKRAIHISGERRNNALVLTAQAGSLKVFEQALPLKEFFLSDGLMPSLPIAGFEVGQTYEIPVFNPILQSTALAKIEVKERARLILSGMKVDCFHLETQVEGITYQSWVTPDGETLRQEIPPPTDVVLVRETREEARRGFLGGE